MASASVSNVLDGYPTKFGQKAAFAVDWIGPTLYATGGVALTAAQLGIGGIDAILGAASQSGNYFAVGRCLLDGAQRSWMVQVFLASTGAEAGAIDLDAEVFRLVILGV